MPGQCDVAVGAEDDWREWTDRGDEGTNSVSQGGAWTAVENWRVDGNAGTGAFLLREERRAGGKMRLCTEEM
jgi:hypothetical protein